MTNREKQHRIFQCRVGYFLDTRLTVPVLQPCLFLPPPKKTFLEVQNRESEAAGTSETSVTLHQLTRWYIPGYLNLHQLRCWNVECHRSDILEGCILFLKLCVPLHCGINVYRIIVTFEGIEKAT
jgi:hypothetical protein